MSYEKVGKSLGLDFWAKMISAFVPASLLVGYIFLNFYYAIWWGFTDYSLSKAVCVAVMIWCALMLGLAYLYGRFFDLMIKKLETAKHKNTILWALIVSGILLFSIPLFPETQRLVKNHQIYLPLSYALAILLSIFYVGLLHLLALTFSWAEELKKKRSLFEDILTSSAQTNGKHRRYLLSILIFMPVLAFSFLVFALTYSLIPARYGGGGIDRIQLWVSRRALPIFSESDCRITPDNEEAHETGAVNNAEEYLHYSAFYLIHEGTDSLILSSDKCNQVLQVSKEFVKGRQWRNRTPIKASQK